MISTSAPKPTSAVHGSAIVRALPPLGALVLPTLFWALSCVAAGLAGLIFTRGWTAGPQAYSVAVIYGVGAALAVWPSSYFARLFIAKHSMWRLALLVVLLLGFTTLITACVLALQHRVYYSQWHGDPLSRIWFWQQAFTGGAAVYTYVVLGLRLYVPAAIVALVVTSWWLNRLPD